MKYEVGKAYLHDGSAECPLPKHSRARYLTERGTGWGQAADICWPEVLCFVPTYIQPQPRGFWIAIISKPSDHGPIGRAFLSKDDAESWLDQSFCDGKIIHVGEVIE